MIKQLLAIAGTALLVTSCQEANQQKNIAADSMAREHPATDNRDLNTSPTPPTSTAKYVDLKTGQPVELYYNSKKKRTYSEVTNEPVDWYVNVATGDTVYGRGRYVVNNYTVRTPDGAYKLDDRKIKVSNGELKLKEGDQKLKMDENELKIKDGDEKIKTDEGEVKMKSTDKKEKVEIKTDDYKMKQKKEKE